MAFRRRRGLVTILNGASPTRVRKNPLIAIVDDDKSIRDTTQDLLESAGFLAVKFASASHLLKSRRLKSIDCLIADVRMPAMTGLELYQHLITLRRPIPTILITAYPNERTHAQATEAYIVCCLAKPFAAEELLTCVGRALQRSNDR
jgi:FixJ family two-component response regulator